MSVMKILHDTEVLFQSYHKEESKERIKTDATYKNALKEKIDMSMDLLDPEQDPEDGLVNTVTWKVISDRKVSVD